MNIEVTKEDRDRAMAAHLCGLLWLVGGPVLFAVQVSGGRPYRYPFCLRLVK